MSPWSSFNEAFTFRSSSKSRSAGEIGNLLSKDDAFSEIMKTVTLTFSLFLEMLGN
ncbi:hypothetical protein MTR_6g081910 [Medicago truncatula]|uniref:Uncharacterized protein n=1 Tax=Medicago truncatula TaxID=3880 RepID=G7KM56_MEDTR|nr:hypothetical protein MTR_6g081910 [Medicago truncatula]